MATTHSHCSVVQLRSSFAVHISPFPGPYPMEAIRVFLQEVMHSNCSPSCKASLFTEAAKQNASTTVVASGKLYFIAKCKQTPHVWRFQAKTFFETVLWPLDAAHRSPSMTNDAQNPTTSLSITEGRRMMWCQSGRSYPLLGASSGKNGKEGVPHALSQPILLAERQQRRWSFVGVDIAEVTQNCLILKVLGGRLQTVETPHVSSGFYWRFSFSGNDNAGILK